MKIAPSSIATLAVDGSYAAREMTRARETSRTTIGTSGATTCPPKMNAGSVLDTMAPLTTTVTAAGAIMSASFAPDP